MKRSRQILRQALRTALEAVGAFALWTLWLALGLLLLLQLYIATTSELALPDFVVARLENSLAEAGIRATFARTSFDPTGRVLIEQLTLAPTTLPEPVLRARAVYVRLNPWMLVVGRIAPGEIRIMGATAEVPALLSGTGRAEEIVRDFEATLLPGTREISVAQLTARVGGVLVTARGTLPLPRPRATPASPLPAFFAQTFPTLSRAALAWQERLQALESPSVHLQLERTDAGAPAANITLGARALHLAQPIALDAEDLQLDTRVLVLEGQPHLTRLDLRLAGLRTPLARGVAATHLRGTLLGRWQGAGAPELRSAEINVDALTVAGVPARAVSIELLPRPLPRLDATITLEAVDSPLLIRASGDYAARTASARFAGALSPQLMVLLSERLKIDLRRFFDFDAIEVEDGQAQLAAGGKFGGASAQLRLREVRAYGVTFNEGRALLTFDGRRFTSPEVWGRVGENFARGTYEHELPTHDYRFLLTGRLQPLAISPWFRSGWWEKFFRDFVFPAGPPPASVDVRGRWRDVHRSAIFVYADTPRPTIRRTDLDRVRARLFIRPGFVDGLEIFATRGTGEARGRFTLIEDLALHEWRSLEVAADSSIALPVVKQMLGPAGEKLLGPYQLENAPEIRLRGHFDGPAASQGEHYDVRLDAVTAGGFRLFGFPLQDVSFNAHIRDDEVDLSNIQARFGGGTTRGKARLWSHGGERRLGFDLALNEASLGEAAAALTEFRAQQKGTPPTPPGKFVQEKASVRINLAASAEGRFDDLLSYHGTGNAVLTGAEIGEVPLLGALSQVLTFTALRFTSVRTNFRLEGPRLVFPDLAVRGANSAIDAHGSYLLDKHELDFNAKIYPFQESGNLLKSALGVVLTPLSSVFEVKLTGSLEKPSWGLALGPGNLLRPRSPENGAETAPKTEGTAGAPATATAAGGAAVESASGAASPAPPNPAPRAAPAR